MSAKERERPSLPRPKKTAKAPKMKPPKTEASFIAETLTTVVLNIEIGKNLADVFRAAFEVSETQERPITDVIRVLDIKGIIQASVKEATGTGTATATVTGRNIS